MASTAMKDFLFFFKLASFYYKYLALHKQACDKVMHCMLRERLGGAGWGGGGRRSDIMLKRQRKSKHIILYSIHTQKRQSGETDRQTNTGTHTDRMLQLRHFFAMKGSTWPGSMQLNQINTPPLLLSLVGTPMFEGTVTLPCQHSALWSSLRRSQWIELNDAGPLSIIDNYDASMGVYTTPGRWCCREEALSPGLWVEVPIQVQPPTKWVMLLSSQQVLDGTPVMLSQRETSHMKSSWLSIGILYHSYWVSTFHAMCSQGW